MGLVDEIKSWKEEWWNQTMSDCMKTVYEDGKLLNEVVFSTVRANANK